MVELSGALNRVELLPMVHFLANLQQSGSVYLSGGGWSARLGFHGGRLVAASFAEERGLKAIDALRLVMSDADFVFTAGVQPGDDDLDLAPDRLHEYLHNEADNGALTLDAVPRHTSGQLPEGDRVLLKRSTLRTLLAVDGRRTIGELLESGSPAAILMDVARLLDLGLITLSPPVLVLESIATAPSLPAPPPSPPRAAHPAESGNGVHIVQDEPPEAELPLTDSVCPKLGFADDPEAHFARPTALHRCFAGGQVSGVSTVEQRELCLSGKYGTCPRLRQALTPALNGNVGGHVEPASRTEASAAPAQPPEPTWTSRVLPPVSIALFIAAVISTFLVFVGPRLQPAQQTIVVSPPAIVEPTTLPAAPAVVQEANSGS